MAFENMSAMAPASLCSSCWKNYVILLSTKRAYGLCRHRLSRSQTDSPRTRLDTGGATLETGLNCADSNLTGSLPLLVQPRSMSQRAHRVSLCSETHQIAVSKPNRLRIPLTGNLVIRQGIVLTD